MKSQQPVISLQGVTKDFGAVRALDNVSVALGCGQLLAIIGPNGSGKTTLLRSLVGLVQPDSGELAVSGLNPQTHSYEITKLVAVVPDEDDIIESLTAREYLAFIAALYEVDRTKSAELIERSLNLLGLSEVGSQLAGTFSHGMRKKLQIAGALVSGVKILIIDEPTNGLDPDMISLIQALLARLRNDGYTIIVATHQLDFAASIADSVLILRSHVYAYDSVQALLKQTNSLTLAQAYLSLTGGTDYETSINTFLAHR